MKRIKSELQSILFPVDNFTVTKAKAWLKSHGKKYTKVHTTKGFHRFRQVPPSRFKKMRTITLDKRRGIEAVVGLNSKRV